MDNLQEYFPDNKMIKDNFGNEIRVGDYVFLKYRKMCRDKVIRVTNKGVFLENHPWCTIDLVVKDNTQELDYLHDLLRKIDDTLPSGLEGLIGISLGEI